MSRKSRRQLEEFRDGILGILSKYQIEMSETLDQKLKDIREVDQEEAKIQMEAVKTGMAILISGLDKEMLDMIIDNILNKKKGGK